MVHMDASHFQDRNPKYFWILTSLAALSMISITRDRIKSNIDNLQQPTKKIDTLHSLVKYNSPFNEWKVWYNMCEFSHIKYQVKMKRKEASIVG
jgi:hypothetical protein